MVFYLVEHLEEGDKLSDWCHLEYNHMLTIVRLPDKMVFTNVKSKDINNTLKRENSEVFELSLRELIDADSLSLPLSIKLTVPFDRVCLLDMKAKGEIVPADSKVFDVVVFGGILGNVHVMEDGTYSSDDKTAIVRNLGFDQNRRHLGELQMTTDTAVLVTNIVLRQHKQLADIPFIDHPEIGIDSSECTVMEGFRYVEKNGKPVIPEGMAQLLADSMDYDLTEELI